MQPNIPNVLIPICNHYKTYNEMLHFLLHFPNLMRILLLQLSQFGLTASKCPLPRVGHERPPDWTAQSQHKKRGSR